MTPPNDSIQSINFRKPLPHHPVRLRVPIFLDFEGVLRTASSDLDAGFSLARNFLAPLTQAEALGLSPQLVIASTYRLQFSVNTLAQMLESTAPGLGRFVLSSTPSESSMNLDREQRGRHRLAPRLYEVTSWLEAHGMLNSPWIAIDDTPSLYGFPIPTQLIVCDARLGFNTDQAQALSKRLTGMVPAPPLTCSPAPPLSGSGLSA